VPKTMERLFYSDKVLVVIFTIILFGLGLNFGIAETMISAMSFLIMMEIVRTIYEYIVNPEHRVKMRYIIDSAILFGIRELFVGWIMLKTNLILGLIIAVISIFFTWILIKFRKSVIESSPDVLEN